MTLIDIDRLIDCADTYWSCAAMNSQSCGSILSRASHQDLYKPHTVYALKESAKQVSVVSVFLSALLVQMGSDDSWLTGVFCAKKVCIQSTINVSTSG